MKTEIGGDRLGSGNEMNVSMKDFERSNHDLSYTWRTTMASGTLVPFMSKLAVPGDTWDIDLNCMVKTLPTTGPLYGSYKVQLDIFQCPIRLYQGKLHMNMLNIGMDMAEVKLPQIKLDAEYEETGGDNQQVNSSCLLSYLGIRGLGRYKDKTQESVSRDFNAVPILGYWDVYKQYYANKQQETGVVIHGSGSVNSWSFTQVLLNVGNITQLETYQIYNNTTPNVDTQGYNLGVDIDANLVYDGTDVPYGEPDVNDIRVSIDGTFYNVGDIFDQVGLHDASTNGDGSQWRLVCRYYTGPRGNTQIWVYPAVPVKNTEPRGASTPELLEFPLTNIDDMRMEILEAVRQTTAFEVTSATQSPYGLLAGNDGQRPPFYNKLNSQEGLGVKTYQSDLFNNWISTEWIDGPNGVNEVSKVSTTGNEFTIDALNLANKIYNMLNRIAISGGSYDDWLEAQYTHERAKGHESPIYHGSLIKELGFEEVVSQSDVETTDGNQPLGTLAGRGRLSDKHKGGKMKIKVNEPSYLIGLISITPRIDYSQGNQWDTSLKTMNDLMVPSLNSIGFQDLVTDQMAWFDTSIDELGNVEYNSAGKQPAWINYMTDVNKCLGDFAVEGNSMFMTLNRKYEHGANGIEDLTTYVDPSKYNSIFAVESLDSQNFWVQVRNEIFARRKMSAKVIPNL
jgi:hypothetical protein